MSLQNWCKYLPDLYDVRLVIFPVAEAMTESAIVEAHRAVNDLLLL